MGPDRVKGGNGIVGSTAPKESGGYKGKRVDKREKRLSFIVWLSVVGLKLQTQTLEQMRRTLKFPHRPLL